jgi:cellulose synthase/poly-beta-1,6-N-acetylglucosamine synthase-like glycosyltransferase
MTVAVIIFSGVIIAGLAVYHGFNLATIALAAVELRRQRWFETRRLERIAIESGALPSVAVIVPAYNEQVSIVQTLESVLRLSYPDLQIIVVSDGSTDQTLATLAKAFRLRPSSERPGGPLATQAVRAVFRSETDSRLLVVDKRNGGKADALNAGINMAASRLVLAIDADVVLDKFALVHLALPFITDPTTVASSGMIRPYNGCAVRHGRLGRVGMPSTLLESCQVIEYLRAYGIGRLFFNRLNAHLIISGAFGLFDRDLLLQLGGYQRHAIGEDMELVVRIHRYFAEHDRVYRVWFSADALCLTEAPHSLTDFGKQRTRWHQGLLSTLRIHRGMTAKRRYGMVGLVAFPYFFLELYAPVLEALGWLALVPLWFGHLLTTDQLLLFAAVSLLLSASVSLAAIFLDVVGFRHFEHPLDRAKLVGYAALEHLGYRQLTIYYRLRAFYRYYRTVQLSSGWTPPARMT